MDYKVRGYMCFMYYVKRVIRFKGYRGNMDYKVRGYVCYMYYVKRVIWFKAYRV